MSRLYMNTMTDVYLGFLIVFEAVSVVSKCIVEFCQQDPGIQVNTLTAFISNPEARSPELTNL